MFNVLLTPPYVEHFEHVEHTLWGVFNMFDILLNPPSRHKRVCVDVFVVLLTPALMLNIQNMPKWCVLGVRWPHFFLLPPQHPKHDVCQMSHFGCSLAPPHPPPFEIECSTLVLK